MTTPTRTVAVIGAGFSGSMTAVHLLGAGARVILAEASGRFGPGVAYGTDDEAHLLNVPAGRMGAWPDRETDFLRWLHERQPAGAAPIDTGAYVPRRWFGRYVAEILGRAAASGPGVLERRPERALSLDPRPDHAVVAFERSAPVRADRVVLALGNADPLDPPVPHAGFFDSPRYFRSPWAPGVGTIWPDSTVLLLGTGLTMYDAVLSLVARGHRGKIVAISRRGLRPQPHRSPSRPPARLEPWPELDAWPGGLTELLKLVRRRVRDARRSGGDWREVINSLRPVTAKAWRKLDTRERGRFLERLRPYWDAHRHRAADSVARQIDRLIHGGSLSVRAARLVEIRPAAQGFDAVIRPRGAPADEVVSAHTLINCTGPRTDPRTIEDPLVRDLVARGVATPDPLGLGVLTADDGALIDPTGAPSPVVFTLGPWRRPLLWETTAVPELRAQARDLTKRVMQ
jgi:uncharacterized NAD(P)/FAD-binding protein YdhS